jgi:hypothetical protein
VICRSPRAPCQAGHGFSPRLDLYLRSYVVKQITLAYLTVAAVGLVFLYRRRINEPNVPNRIRKRLAQLYRDFGRRLLLALTLVICFGTIFVYVSPHSVRHIRIEFLDEPTFDKYAFGYTVYELNREQNYWHFDINFDVFNADATLTQLTLNWCTTLVCRTT